MYQSAEFKDSHNAGETLVLDVSSRVFLKAWACALVDWIKKIALTTELDSI